MSEANNEAALEMNSIGTEPKDKKPTATDASRDGSDPPDNSGPGWFIRNANEIVNVCAAFVILVLAFGALTAYTGKLQSLEGNSWQFLLPVGILTTSAIGILIFGMLAVRGEKMLQDRVPHRLSIASLKTLKAAGLPRDLSGRLREILEEASAEPPSPVQLTVIGREHLPNTWIADLDSTFGESRVLEYEDMLFKYTARQTKA
ncbi:MAG: hypothetical protein DMF63_02035 [Acidobacteria bacterium]|nr:MAG: hypothetical protein DMF63_02035 [Acidobacteriota bacterium]